MIETHAHLYDKKYDADRDEMIERALTEGISKFYMPNVDTETIDGMMEVENRHPQAVATMGIHPCSVNKNVQQELYKVEDWLSKRKFAAVGEIGLDYYWDLSFKEQQIEAFKVQISLAKEYQIPIIIHCRDSFDECFEIVRELKDENLNGVFHCFSGTAEEARQIKEIGFYIGIGGIVTFKNGGLAEHIPSISLENVVLETDSPYLTPHPHRGKRNEPAYLKLIAQKIADLKEMPLSELEAITDTNASNLFNGS